MFRRLALLAAAAAVGYGVGWAAGAVGHLLPRSEDYPFLAERAPLPHHIPPVKGGAALRFAMVHDILHERYPRHGKAYYAERVRVTQRKLAALAADDPAAFALTDDLAVALDHLGHGAEAVELLQVKLHRQEAQKRPERERYTTYANLGTLLVRIPGRGQEGLDLLRKSIEVNPTAHFGREKWQAQFDAHVLNRDAAAGRIDAVGNRLDMKVEEALDREQNWIGTGFGRPTDADFSSGRFFGHELALFEPGLDPADPARWDDLRPIRDHITRVGPLDSHGARGTVPFDEPTVAIVGIWRNVRGPDAHLALALGETMLRVGQRHLAWSAYERARRLAVPGGSTAFHDHCRARQADLEQTFINAPPWTQRQTWQRQFAPLTAAEVADLRPRFEAELAHGEAYQRAYQEYEERQIAAGVPLDDPSFYDHFHAGREPIASPIGPAEWFVWVPRAKLYEYQAQRRRSWGVVGAGLAALLAAVLIRRRATVTSSRR